MSWQNLNGQEAGQSILRPLCQGPKSRFHFGVYDIETPGKHSLKFLMVGFFDGKTYKNFRRLSDFLSAVLVKRYEGWRFFAHFGGRFDVHYIYDWLRKNEPDTQLEIICAGSCVIGLTVRIGKRRWRFCDSYRLLKASLKRLTEDFEVEHKKLPFDPTSIEYNRNDCLGLYEVLDQFFDAFDLTSETIASHALRVFRTHFQKKDLYMPHLATEGFVRRAYFGGRCEIYRFDRARLNKYDVNSIYAKAMESPVPVEYLGASVNLPDDDRRIGFFHARINYPETYLPALPWKGDKLYFPVGSFEGHFSSIELRQAIDDGAAVKILSGCLFHTDRIFQDFVKTLYELKSQAERKEQAGARYVYKQTMCALYGKFGQRRMQRVYLIDDGAVGLYPLPEGIAWKWSRCYSSHILPHISAAITSRARIIQLQWLRKTRVWYTDTDSVFTDGLLPVSRKLGALKLEGVGDFQAHRLKEYEFGGAYAIKGLPRSDAENEDERDKEDRELAERYLAGEVIERENMAGFRDSLRRGEKTVRRVKSSKHFNPEIRDKRARDGIDTRPWNVQELDL